MNGNKYLAPVVGIILATLLVICPALAQLDVSITYLGPLEGDDNSTASDINDLGQIVGSSTKSYAMDYGRAVRWSGGTIEDLGVLEGFSVSEARAINNLGRIVGDLRHSSLSLTRAFLWNDGVMQNLGWLGEEDPPFSYSRAYAINNLNQVVGNSGQSYPSPAFSRAFLWTESGGMQDLGTLDGGNSSCAYDINDLGQVVGYSTTASTFGSHAVLWTESGEIQDLGTFGYIHNEAVAINDAGQVVIQCSDTHMNSERAFLLSLDTMQTQDIGGLGGGTTAWDINNLGQVVGHSFTGNSTYPLPPRHAFFWDGTEIHDLTPDSKGSSTWGINDRGQLVGQDHLSSGEDHAVLWEVALPPPPADEQIDEVQDLVDDFVAGDILNEGQGDSLNTKLESAKTKIDEGNSQAACKLLQAFIKQVEAMVRSGKLSQVEADALIGQAELASPCS